MPVPAPPPSPLRSRASWPTPAPVPAADVPTAAGPLVVVQGLQDRLGAVTLLDVRYRLGAPHGAQDYAVGHLPGAVYVDLETELAAPAAPDGVGGRHPLPEPDAFAEAMRRVGVCDDRPVVVYDDWGSRAAARAWWLLSWCGHRDVRVLDGGWRAWCEAGAPTESTATAERPGDDGDFTARPGARPLVRAEDLGEVAVLVDAREAARFRGEHEPVDPVAGHVPGALNLATSLHLDEVGRLLYPGALQKIYARVGVGADLVVDPAGQSEAAPPGVAVYCGSGVTACLDLLALEVIGVRGGLYAGSWSDWVSDPTRPVARGPS